MVDGFPLLGVGVGQAVSTTLILHCNIVITWILLTSNVCSWVQASRETIGNLAFQACLEFPV